MNERVQLALDGHLERGELGPAERTELESVERLLTAVTDAIPDQPMPDLTPAVLARLASLPGMEVSRPGGRPRLGWLSWLWTPRAVSWSIRPAYALAAVLLLAIALVARSDRGAMPATSGLSSDPLRVLVQFQLLAPEASAVSLAGDFSDWEPRHPLSRTEEGVWQVFVPLTPGVHEYAFVIDGQRWQPDPLAPGVADGFGGVNSRVAVLSGGERGL